MDLTPAQATALERILKAGFRFVTLEHMERYLGAEKNGFVALLDPSQGKLKLFGQVGYRMGEGMGMLVERLSGKVFVWHTETIAATPELLCQYERFKAELQALLEVQM